MFKTHQFIVRNLQFFASGDNKFLYQKLLKRFQKIVQK